MRIAYKDRCGGPWREWRPKESRTLFTKRAPITEQLKDLEHVGNIIIATVRGNKIKPRAVRGY